MLAGLTQQDPDLLLFKGQLHFYQKQWRQAVQYYRDYLRQRPQDLAARRQLAQALSFYPAGLAEAAQEYESAALASGDPGLLLQRAAVLLQLAQNTFDDPTQQAAAPERWRAAATALRQVPASDLSPELLRELGRLYLWLGDLEQALACLEKYLVVRPFDRAAQVEKARVLIYLQHGAAAMEVLRRLPPAAAGQSPSPADPAAGGARKNRRQGQHQHPRRPLLPEPRWRF
uniref:tetratricopeptide repeat protein n=1 Tax=Desulfobacca sp. TaxID=2067990 RepID=UPI00404AED1A